MNQFKPKRKVKPITKILGALVLAVAVFFGYTHFVKDNIPQSMKETVAEVDVDSGEQHVTIGVVTWPGL